MKIHISYVYHQSPRSDYNFSYFLDNELKYKPNIFYTIVVNGFKCSFEIPKLDNCRVIYKDNTGYDFGGHNVALKKLGTDIKSFDYFFFMNCGVIGPILKNKSENWYNRFTDKFNERVKLVGTTIVCIPKKNHPIWVVGPCVEGFCFCLDRQGLDLVLKDGTIFYNHANKTDAIHKGEYSLSRCITRAGYTIDCMLTKYNNIDWLNPANHKINNNVHPSRQNSFYGKSINPYEVIFHKWFWKHQPKKPVSLDIIERHTGKKFPDNRSFDYNFYISKYKDLRKLSPDGAYQHYINYGVREGRTAIKRSINTTTNITIILHLFNTSLFYEMLSYITQVKEVFSSVNVIISVNKNINNNICDNILKLIPECFLLKVDNKGVDVYPFILSVKYLRENKIKTDFILKLHTKESSNDTENLKNWRKEAIMPIVKYDNLLVLQNYFKKIDNLGYVSAQKCILPKNFDLDFPQNINGLNKLSQQFPHLEKEWTDFNAGNIFWISNKVLDQYLTDELITYIISKVSYGKPPCNLTDKGIYIEYLCERLFTGLFCFNKTNIGVNEYSGTKRGVSFNNKYFYQPKVFSINVPKYIHELNSM